MKGYEQIALLFFPVLFLFAGGALAVEPAYAETFSASFGAYRPGEALGGAKGTSGGTWSLATGTVATNILDAGRAAMVVDGTARFDASIQTAGNLERIDFSFRIEFLEKGAPPTAGDAMGGFMPARIGERTGYYGWGDGRWQALFADGADPVDQTWAEGRLESKTIDGIRFLSYLVKSDAGVFVRCADAAGRTWFRAGPAAAKRGVSFSGCGVFAEFSGQAASADFGPTYYWAGGKAGDWNDPANWTSNGVAGAGVPGAGSYAFVTNAVSALTNGNESASVAFLAVADGHDLIGADFETSVELEVNRVRVGKALTPEVLSFFGATPDYDYTWERAAYGKGSFKTFSRGPSWTPQASDYCQWIRFTASKQGAARYSRTFYCSKLPVCYLTTDDGKTPSASKEEHTGTLFVQGNDEFKKQYDGAMTINVRGNSSKNYAKKPYKIKLDEKTKMFGLGEKKSKHWVFLANYNDLSSTRNKLPYDFANEVGGTFGMHSTFVDCVLNGKVIGVYQFCEHIRVAEDRVNIYDWEDHAEEYGATETNFAPIDALLAADPNVVDITGGYLFEFSTEADEVTKFDIAAGSLTMHTMASRPEYLKTSARMLAWSKNFLQDYFSAITSWDGCTARGRPWSELCDVDSMVGFFLVNELFDNGDMGQKSRYAAIDRGGKLVWGPVWDYDWGSASITVDNTPERWRSAGGGEANMNREWTTDPWFCLKAYEKYWEIRDRYAATYAPDGAFDQVLDTVRESMVVDEKLWATRKDKSGAVRTFAGDAAILRTFHQKRLAWMDRQFADVPTLMASLRNSSQTHAYMPDAHEIVPRVESGKLVFDASFIWAHWVKVILNGQVVGTFTVKDGRIAGRLPASACVVGKNRRNCLSFIAYNRSGTVIARNYALFNYVPKGFVLVIK